MALAWWGTLDGAPLTRAPRRMAARPLHLKTAPRLAPARPSCMHRDASAIRRPSLPRSTPHEALPPSVKSIP
eukprot:6170321-Pyramimonas_sp.AAC.1